MTTELKAGFLLYANYYDILKDLSDEDAGILFKAILKYQATKEEVKLPMSLALAFKFIKNQFDIDDDKYKKFQEKQRQNGSRGGRPKKDENPKNPKNPTLFFETQKSLKDKDKDKVKDNVITLKNSIPTKKEIEDYCKINAKKIDIDEFIAYYNASDWLDKNGLPINWKQKVLTFARNYKPKEEDKPYVYNPCL